MANTKRLSFKDEVERAVMNALLTSAHTVRELESLTGFNYYTIRNTVLKFEDQGLIKSRGFRRNARIWSLIRESDPDQGNNSMPTARGTSGKPLKIINVLNYVGNEKTMVSFIAAKDLPKTVTRALMMALRAKQYPGQISQTELDTFKLEMENNAKSLKTTLDLYNAMLNSKILWDADLIKAIYLDVDFNEEQIIAAYHYYFPNA